MRPLFKIGILDLMVLVAGAAAGLAAGRVDIPTVMKWVPGATPNSVAHEAHYRRLFSVVSVLTGMTPAVLILRLRSPRPALRRLARQPGFLACALAAAALAVLAGRTV